MILVDANVFMYASGRPSPQRAPCRAFLLRAAQGRTEDEACTDVEVLQEILHRYRVVGEPQIGTSMFDEILSSGMSILPVGERTMRHARAMLDEHTRISTRDAVHAGVMLERGIARVLSYDRGFDAIEGIERMEP